MLTDVKTGRSLVLEPLFARLVNRLVTDHADQLDPDRSPDAVREYAERLMDQALAFLGTCAVTDERMSPSEAVDIGWHTFILHTREYTAFCDLVAGRYIHHVPTDQDGPAVRAVLDRTVAEIRRAGFVVDDELWQYSEADCSQCYQGCSNSPHLT